MIISNKVKKAFTMAEAILVMTILGIIATVALTTLKPAQYKEQALSISAKKVLGEVDAAVTNIMLNDSKDGSFLNLLTDATPRADLVLQNGATIGSAPELMNLFKKYMVTTRATVNEQFCKTGDIAALASATNIASAYLKDGACLGLYLGAASNYETIFPGETAVTSSAVQLGLLFFDTNGEAEPNAKGKDQFILPLYKEGIDYSVKPATT